MSTAVALAPRLALIRIRRGTGGASLDLLAVLAFTVSTALALTVAGGTWMFVQRADDRAGALSVPLLDVARFEVLLAYFACALLVVPILGLGGSAARLGARARSRRLASLRLLGMTGGDVVSMSLVETLVQAVLGVVAGSLVYVLSLPAWQAVSFQGRAIQPGEMVAPWWLWLAVVAAVLGLALASTALGLQRVRISPLGVSRNETTRALQVWRLALVAVLVIAFMTIVPGFNLLSGAFVAIMVSAGLLGAVIGGMNLLGPFILQFAALPFARTSRVPQLIAMRRITGDPRAAWRNVSAVALLAFIAAFVAMVPVEPTIGPPYAGTMNEYEFATRAGFADLRTGVAITLAVGLVLSAVSVLMTQASSVFDRAGESVSLDRMGLPRSAFAAIRRIEVLLPLVVTLVIAIGLGVLLGTVFNAYGFGIETEGAVMVGVVVAIGVAGSLLAAEACRPLQNRVLGEQRRRND